MPLVLQARRQGSLQVGLMQQSDCTTCFASLHGCFGSCFIGTLVALAGAAHSSRPGKQQQQQPQRTAQSRRSMPHWEQELRRWLLTGQCAQSQLN